MPIEELHFKVLNYLNNKHQVDIKQISYDVLIEVVPFIGSYDCSQNTAYTQMLSIYDGPLFDALGIAKLAKIYCKERIRQLASFGLITRALREIVEVCDQIYCDLENQELIGQLEVLQI